MRENAEETGSEKRRKLKPAKPQRADAGLKAYRDRLAHGTENKPEFEHELLMMFARNETRDRFAMPAIYVFFFLASLSWERSFEPFAWIMLVILTKFLMARTCEKFLNTPRSEINVGEWKARFIRLELLNGFFLGLFALVGFISGQGSASASMFSSHVFIFATLMVVLAVRMTFAATLTKVFLAGTVPMTLAVVLRLVAIGEPFYFALAAMAVGIHLFFLYLANGIYSTSLAMVEFRAAKDGLISELEEATAVSDEARRRAEAANKMKSRFLATMSHELRTPLNAIMGFSEVMEKELLGPIGSDTYRDYSKNIYASGNHLLHIINEILDLSRIEAGKYELHEETIRLTDIAEDCERLIKIRAEAKGLQLIEDFDPQLPQIWADPRAMRQICLNLLSNALKFTPKGGKITITIANTVDGGQYLAVRDTGPGIPKDEIPRVLQAFGQGSLAHENAEGGTGLGLPIVQNLIQLHGGTFNLQSELRKGTEVSITLPPQRVLRAVAPLQQPGLERHKEPVAPLPKSTRQPRMKPSSPYGSETPYRTASRA